MAIPARIRGAACNFFAAAEYAESASSDRNCKDVTMSRKASMSEADTLRTSAEEFWSKMDQKGDALASA